ncbi:MULTISPECIES: RusA family crossover junction endodeoxyribonuclease [unclassified Clostridium]|uniref:RusA family crossover junction endodeoxyribonuclease n=1 Tax=unclassified Clostridium TaxID=2614128 RepID=UPI0025BD3A85|nr:MULTISPECIES: RusA family crossover junction endodeoxyribonuclease [unclassified Clostridium]
MELKLICSDFISVNHYMNYRVVGKIVMAYKPTKTKDFEKRFSDYAKEQMKLQKWIKPTKDKFIFVDTIFYFPRIDMDCNNYYKSTLDTLTNCGIWEDDNMVLERSNRVYYDKENPRIEFTITVAPYVGIFDNVQEYEHFKSTCKKCRRFKNNCTIHRESLESRIRDEVIKDAKNQWKCNKFKEVNIT